MGAQTQRWLSDERLQERLFETKLADGPAVFVLPRPGYRKSYATFATRYGSVDNCFQLPGQPVAARVPDGIAHFLEHQMFAQEDGDAFDRFAALGASANAYTSYTSTTYLFATTEQFDPAFAHLLAFVQQPHFTDAGTNKERGIIQQEIRMYADNPDWRLRQLLHEGLYQRHPFAIDIAGTVQSVEGITTELLQQCYETFYHPANMVVCVVGDVDADHVVEMVQQSLAAHPRGPWSAPRRWLPDEPAAVRRPSSVERMSVARPMLAVGFKERPGRLRGRAQLERDTWTEIGLDAVFGRSSHRFASWYEAGLVDHSFSAGYYGEETFGLAQLGGETDDPQRLEAEIRQAVEDVRRNGVPRDDCERLRRSRLGEFVREFNSPESLGHALVALYFSGVDVFAYREVLEELTAESVSARLAEHLDPERCSVAMILPVE